jgi:hypothetical protein
LCTAFNASRREIRAPVPGSGAIAFRKAVSRSARTESSWPASWAGQWWRGEDAKDLPALRAQQAAAGQAVIQANAYTLAESRHDILRLPALFLTGPGERLVEQRVRGRARIPDNQVAPSDLLRGTRKIQALHQGELDEQRAAKRHVDLAGAGDELPRLIVREEEKEVPGDEHALDPRPEPR